MNTIEVGKWVVHTRDSRKGEVVELKDHHARIFWKVKSNGELYSTDTRAIMSGKAKRTWVRLKDLTLTDKPVTIYED